MIAHRRELGQWFTAAPVAQLALAALAPIDARARVLDPTCGDGAFLAAAYAAGLRDLTGVEIDRDAAAAARARVPARIVDGDLLSLPLGEYDLVIGNPPYVRAGSIDPRIKKARRDVLYADWPELDRGKLDVVARLADASATYLLRALRLCAPGGRLGFVVSTGLLDTDAASALWELVERVATVRALIIAPGERWFDDAAVNPMLLIAERRTERAPARVMRLRVPTSIAAREHGLDGIASVADVRRATTPTEWGPALRAPRVWWQWRDVARDRLVPLGTLADIRRGMTTGANDVFYVTRKDARALRLEPEYLAPVVRSPFNGSPAPIAIDPDETALLAIALPPDPKLLRKLPRMRTWLMRHEQVALRSSVSRRDPWWSLPLDPARLFLAKAYGPRFVQRLAAQPILGDQRVYGLHPKPGVDVEALAAVLNALPTALAIESLGRASMGYGAVEWTVHDALELPVLDVRRLDERTCAQLRQLVAAFGRRPIEHVRLERDRADRAALDRAVLDLAAGTALTDDMWTALLASVALRDRYLLPAV